METRTSKNEPGLKFDYGKERYDLIPGDSLDQLAHVYTYGASKYADNNWRKGMSWGRCFGAMMRHAWAWWRGEKLDEESGCHHLAMTAWYCFSLMNYEKTHPDKDDRVKDLVVEHAKVVEAVGPEIRFDPDLDLTPERLANIKESAQRLVNFLKEKE